MKHGTGWIDTGIEKGLAALISAYNLFDALPDSILNCLAMLD